MVREAIILAGGLGTRLRKVIKDIPKPMAEIGEKPFLEYLFEYLLSQGIRKIILSIGYKGEVIMNYFGKKFLELDLIYSVEEAPLGTGGAIKKSLSYSEAKDIFVLNGDTLFKIDLHIFYTMHKTFSSPLSIALKSLDNPSRYGIVEIDENCKIIGFHEKGKITGAGLINGGIYLLKKSFFLEFKTPEIFSFESDFLEKYYKAYDFFGFPFEGCFIDIGVPEDYERAKKELENFKD